MRKFLFPWVPLILVILMDCGCSRLENLVGFSASPSLPQFTIENVESSGQPGTYSLRGKASFPDKTQLSVSAIRTFTRPGDTQNQDSDTEASKYAILDRRSALVKDGVWQTELSLWQIAPDGRYQETWQLNKPAAPKGGSPDTAVTFLVTLDPPNFSKSVDEQSEAALGKAQSPILGFMSTGEPYLRTARTMAIALPTGQTQAPSLAQSPDNPWKGRSELNEVATSNKPTPLPFDDRDNLPLPKNNMLQ